MPSPLHTARMSARLDGDFVLFLLGARINRWWRIDQWLRVGRLMPAMQRELHARPELGLLGQHTWVSRQGILLVQYWRSVEHLERYAADPESAHRPAWLTYYRALHSSAATGIWHETYLVGPGRYEAIYANMPRFGLAAAGGHLPARRVGHSSAQRRSSSAAATTQ